MPLKYNVLNLANQGNKLVNVLWVPSKTFIFYFLLGIHSKHHLTFTAQILHAVSFSLVRWPATRLHVHIHWELRLHAGVLQRK